MNFHWPQITWLSSVAFNLFVFAALNGKPRDDYNFPIYLCDAGFMLWLLWCGGFFA